MIKICFVGHNDASETIREKAKAVIVSLLRLDNEFEFYDGGMGNFDRICAGIVRELKKQHSDKHIKLILVLPYMTKQLEHEREYYRRDYDEIIVQDNFETMHYKAAITNRNRMMINQSDYIIVYVTRDFGGAAQSLKYAEKRKKQIIRII